MKKVFCGYGRERLQGFNLCKSTFPTSSFSEQLCKVCRIHMLSASYRHEWKGDETISPGAPHHVLTESGQSSEPRTLEPGGALTPERALTVRPSHPRLRSRT